MPRSKEEFKAITTQRKKSILSSALRLFAVRGYDSVSVDDITKASKCSHGLFYHYFSSKADLFEELMKLIQGRWEKLIVEIDFTQSPDKLIKSFTDFYIRQISQGDNEAYVLYLFLTFHLQKSLPNIPHENVKPLRGSFKTLVETVKAGQEQGLFAMGNPFDMCRIYYAALEGLAYNRISLGKKEFRPVNSDDIVNFFLKHKK